MSYRSFFGFCVLASIWVPVFSQTLPAVPKVTSLGGGMPKGIPTNGLEGLASKPAIPRIQKKKRSFFPNFFQFFEEKGRNTLYRVFPY